MHLFECLCVTATFLETPPTPFQTGMRNYYNGGSNSSGATPPPSGAMQPGGRVAGSGSSSSSVLMGGGGPRRSTSTSLPRSPDPNEFGGFSGSHSHRVGGGEGSVSSHDSSSKHEMYANVVYQNVPSHQSHTTNTTHSNHSSMFVSLCFYFATPFSITFFHIY